MRRRAGLELQVVLCRWLAEHAALTACRRPASGGAATWQGLNAAGLVREATTWALIQAAQ